MTARALTVRSGFATPPAVRQWMTEAAQCEGALCTLIAFWIGFFLTLIACS